MTKNKVSVPDENTDDEVIELTENQVLEKNIDREEFANSENKEIAEKKLPETKDSGISEEKTDFSESETIVKENRKDLPIYIVGKNALTFYLGAKLQGAGNKVIVLLEHQNSESSLSTDGISIKEDRSLTQKRHKLETSFLMKYPARMVVITAYADKMNTALSSISTKHIYDAPVVCFTPIKDLTYLQGLLGRNLHPAYFHGFLNYNNQSLSVYGRNGSMTICNPSNGLIDKDVISVFNQTGIEINISNESVKSFWEYFTPYALCSIFSAAENKKISELLKDKELKEKFKPLADEFISLASADGVILNERVILKGIYNTPVNYIYPLHQAIISDNKTEFNLLSSIINDAAHKTKITVSEINKLLKKLYNIVLNQIYS